MVSRPARGGWIEIRLSLRRRGAIWSRPARGGWIEMTKAEPCKLGLIVPPRTGRVD